MLTKDRLYYACQIRYWRRVCQMSHKQLAYVMGVPEQAIYRWESASRTPQPKYWRRLRETLCIPRSSPRAERS
jgi:DNA-binding transcriptional regulator YiaG